MSRNREYRWGIQAKLSLASGLLVLISLASFGLLSYFVTRRTLDDQMGERLVSHAEMAVAILQPYKRFLLSEVPTVYSLLQEKLAVAKAAANLENVILFDTENRVLVDANGELSFGEKYPMLEADQVELRSVWAGNVEASMLYPGRGGRLYKPAYAPVIAEDGKVVAALRVEASARFLNIINSVGFALLLSALIITAMAALLGMLIARSIVIPIKRLVRASQRIADGDLDTAVLIRSRDEIGFFGWTFNQMARNLKRLYEEVEQRGRQIAELAASVAHEVRSPISAIQGFTELLEDDMDDDLGSPSARKRRMLEYTADIKNEAKILDSKITDFIHFAKPLEIEPMPLDIIDVLESALASMDKEITDNDVSVVTNFGSHLPAVLGDFEQLRGLFVNLIRNAVQAMDNGGGLIVSANAVNEDTRLKTQDAGLKTEDIRQEGESSGLGSRVLSPGSSSGPGSWVLSLESSSVQIKIEDTGDGMSREVMEHAFEPFVTTKGSGTGLGLAIVKKIVDAHSGKIELESDVGRGTTVRVFLPVSRSISL